MVGTPRRISIFEEDLMTRTMVIVGVIVLLLGCMTFFFYKVGKIKGNGIIETTAVTIHEFNGIVLNGHAMVRIYESDENKISLTIDSNLVKNISLEVKKNALVIETKNCFGIIFTEFVVDIYTKNINDFTINGNGNINLLGNIYNQNGNRTITLNGSGAFYGEKYETESVTIKINGSGEVKIAAKKYLNGEINGSGHILYYGDPEIKSKITGKGKIEPE
jgi:hypothetical protein